MLGLVPTHLTSSSGVLAYTMTKDIVHGESGSKESHVDRAMLGPTPDNPSLSLEKRLKRARFFDQRERQVAAGEAVPVDPEAGLPDQLIEDISDLGSEP